MFKPNKSEIKLLGIVLIACIISAYGGYYIAWATNGSNLTIDEAKGIYNAPWFNATIGVKAPRIEVEEFYLNSVNITDPLAYPNQPYTFIIYRDGSIYRSIFGINRTVAFTTSEAYQAIEWTWGNCSNGGIIYLYGPGQKWAINDDIDSQASYVKLLSDWSLELELANGVNKDVIRVTHDWVTIYGLYIDGNHAGQIDVDKDNQNVITFMNADYGTIEKCKLIEGFTHGIRYSGTSTTYMCWIVNNYLYGNRANGIIVGMAVIGGLVNKNDVSESSDVGVNIVGKYIICTENEIHHIDNSESPYGTNTQLGICFEGSASGASEHSKAIDNTIYLCKVGISSTTSGGSVGFDILIKENTITNVTNDFISIGSYKDVVIESNVGQWSGRYGIQVTTSSDNVTIKNNRFRNVGDADTEYCIYINSADGCSVDGNDMREVADGMFFQTCTLRSFSDNIIVGVLNGNHAVTFYFAGNGTICEGNHIEYAVRGINLNHAQDIMFSGGYIAQCTTGIYGRNMINCTFSNIMFRSCTTPIDFSDASCDWPTIHGCDWNGCTNDASIAGADNEKLRDNIDKDGSWLADT